MGIQFDEANDYYSISDDPALDLPDGDWCIGIWARVDDLTGSAYQYAYSVNYGANNSYNLYIGENSSSAAGKWIFSAYDANSPAQFISPNAPGADGQSRMIIVQNIGSSYSTIEMWFATVSGASRQVEAVDSGNTFRSVSPPSSLNIGRRSDGNVDRYFGGVLGGFFKGNFILGEEEIKALGRGVSIHALGKAPDVYVPLQQSGLQQELANGLVVTENGSPADAEDFPFIVLSPSAIPVATMAGGNAVRASFLDRQRRL